MVARVLVFHWKPEEIEAAVARLRKHHAVSLESRRDGQWWRPLRGSPPDAVVIDLSRLPSHGREVGSFLRTQKATRRVPLVFAGGEEDKVAGVRSLLPDAHFCTWRAIRSSLTRALRAPVRDPAVPGVFAGYSGTPLPKTLGIKPGSRPRPGGAPMSPLSSRTRPRRSAGAGPAPPGRRATADASGLRGPRRPDRKSVV